LGSTGELRWNIKAPDKIKMTMAAQDQHRRMVEMCPRQAWRALSMVRSPYLRAA
jgi:hypothetical protein